jgi:hypothetical protein
MNETKQSTADVAILDQLNKDYVHSDQFNDVKRRPCARGCWSRGNPALG